MEEVYRITGARTNKAPTGIRYGTRHMAQKTFDADGSVKIEKMSGEFTDVTHEFKEDDLYGEA